MARHKKRNTNNTNNANASNTGRTRAPGVTGSNAPSTQQQQSQQSQQSQQQQQPQQPQRQRAANAPPRENEQARSGSFVGQALLDALEGIDADRSTSGAATPAQELAREATPAPVPEKAETTQPQYATPAMQQQFPEQMPAAPAHNGYGYGFDFNAANTWMAAASAAAWPQMFGGGMDANAQQGGFYNQQFGQVQDGAWGQYQQQTAPYGLGYGIGNAWSAIGNTQAFAPVTSSTMAPIRGYATRAATRAAGRGAGLPTPDHIATTTSESEEGGVRFNHWMGRGSRRAKAKAKSPMRDFPPKGSFAKFPPPPKPDPSPQYLEQVASAPSLRTTPERLLVVIDLNGTLVHRPNRKDSSKVVCRPYAKAFLRYLLANHRVMAWSSARPENVAKMCAQLFTREQRSQLAAEWGRDRLGLTPAQYNEKVQVYKRLEQVWGAAAQFAWHDNHAAGERYAQHNTLLLDDSALKAASEPFNLVQVEEFEAKPHQMLVDVLAEVKGFLEEAKWQKDVSAWIHAGNGFVVGRWKGEWDRGESDGVSPERRRAAELALRREEEYEAAVRDAKAKGAA
ncbi:uncharacterized protein K452DRAFT_242363 [Aplosporella prunicola CBS 121167]|uniref:Mitochondrial import inner membrane translocase subunit TIM50 n=1 Tax=Aplosporella prunicola CBS 121167 TaxID=1176127 RepID=A0A6A6BRN3_9PEZI|nr:uncharacterized protein K452DRAFT_242363 [Aplosporella prunicola CBS 121167]KAF2145945.1 hypothetical protein K452DRAFT_242363 [Aplosporella prunicola CBS 121167]